MFFSWHLCESETTTVGFPALLKTTLLIGSGIGGTGMSFLLKWWHNLRCLFKEPYKHYILMERKAKNYNKIRKRLENKRERWMMNSLCSSHQQEPWNGALLNKYIVVSVKMGKGTDRWYSYLGLHPGQGGRRGQANQNTMVKPNVKHNKHLFDRQNVI